MKKLYFALATVAALGLISPAVTAAKADDSHHGHDWAPGHHHFMGHRDRHHDHDHMHFMDKHHDHDHH